MITTCTGCQTRYRLDDAKVPRRQIRVRCPRCATVFALDGTQIDVPKPSTGDLEIERSEKRTFTAGFSTPPPRSAGPLPAAALAGEPRPVVSPAAAQPDVPGPERSDLRSSEDVSVPLAGPAAAGRHQGGFVSEPEAAPVTEMPEATAGAAVTPAAVVDADAAQRPKRDRDKARRLARALVSDILVYNRDVRDKALQEGNLIQALGPEIKKSWELYKERVTPEVANSTSHFRDALNEILAEGQKVF